MRPANNIFLLERTSPFSSKTRKDFEHKLFCRICISLICLTAGKISSENGKFSSATKNFTKLLRQQRERDRLSIDKSSLNRPVSVYMYYLRESSANVGANLTQGGHQGA